MTQDNYLKEANLPRKSVIEKGTINKDEGTGNTFWNFFGDSLVVSYPLAPSPMNGRNKVKLSNRNNIKWTRMVMNMNYLFIVT